MPVLCVQNGNTWLFLVGFLSTQFCFLPLSWVPAPGAGSWILYLFLCSCVLYFLKICHVLFSIPMWAALHIFVPEWHFCWFSHYRHWPTMIQSTCTLPAPAAAHDGPTRVLWSCPKTLGSMSPHVSAATSVRWTLFNLGLPCFLSGPPLIPCRHHLLILTHSLRRQYLLVLGTTCKLILLYSFSIEFPRSAPVLLIPHSSATSHPPSVGPSNILPSNFLTVSNSMSFILYL